MCRARIVAFWTAICGLASLTNVCPAQQWGMYGGNPQHTAEATNGVQAMNAILWQTPIDLSPPYEGSDLSIHYGSPIVSNGGTVVLCVRNGGGNGFPTTNDTYQIEGHSLATGATVFSQTSDYVDWMPHDWTPTMSAAIDSNDVLYYPGAGGTIYKRSSANLGIATTTQLCFYGLSAYSANASAYNGSVQIDTPIVVDANNNIYFGFYVDSAFYTNGSNTAGLKNGIAKISSTGVGSWVSIDSITGDVGDEIQTNCEPAISNDGTHLYAATKQALWYYYGNPKLIEINTSDLSAVHTVSLTIPASTPSDPDAFAYVMDDGTSSPLVGPDGDVYFGVWYQNIERGFMLHYSGDLSTQKTAGAFGWDDTGAIVPASIVPGYTGTSTYLICTKYNNYADIYAYGDGQNKVAILDPNATETYTIQYGADNPGGVMVGDNVSGTTTGVSYTTMKEIITLLGITPNTGENLEGVREWCVNTVAIDVPGKGAVVNSEDGHCYRWDFTTNAITDSLNLEPPTGEAYTPTLASADGIAIAVNNATVFAMWDGVKPSSIASSAGTSIVGSGNSVGTVTLTGNATGPGATLALTSNNSSLTVPASLHIAAGHNSGTFTIETTTVSGNTSATITAARYGFTATLNVTVKEATLGTFSFAPTSVVGGTSSEATVRLASGAGPSGDVVTISGSGPATLPSTETVPASGTAVSFAVPTAAVSVSTAEVVSATLGSATLHATLTIAPATLSAFTVSPATVVGGAASGGSITLNGKAGPSGDAVALSITGANATAPATVTVASGSTTATFSVSTTKPTSSTVDTVNATWNSITLHSSLTILPTPIISTLAVSPGAPLMTDRVIGTITLNEAVLANTSAVATDDNGDIVVDTQPVVLAGSKTATFSMHAAQLPNTVAGIKNIKSSTVTVSLNGIPRQVVLTISTFGVSSLSLSSATIHAGQATTLTVKSVQPAGVVPLLVNMATSNAALAPLAATTTIPAGSNTKAVTITAPAHVAAKTTVVLTVSISSNPIQTISLTVEP